VSRLSALLSRWLARQSVGRKLMLIYLLDLTAVIFVSAILINEKFLAIDFARKELVGIAYIDAVRTPVVDAARLAAAWPTPPPRCAQPMPPMATCWAAPPTPKRWPCPWSA
jgi:hypothetical protein